MAAHASVFHNAAEGEKLMSATVEFALAMYNNIATTNPGNIFFSPFSISMALAMTYMGARNETAAQMKTGMFLTKVNENEIHKLFSDLRLALKSEGGYKLHVANRLFGQKTYKFLSEYLNATKDLYGAELRPVDFVAERNAAVAEINGWVEEQTNHKIKDIVPIAAVNAMTRLILVNAVYFKGDWSKKFDKAVTKDEDFHVSSSEKVKVPLMHIQKGKFLYGVDQKLNCQALSLPYVGDKLSMIILLPDHTVNTLADFERQLTAAHLIDAQERFQMYKQDVHLWLPRFKLEQSFSLKDVLTQLGMRSMFSSTSDFSGMDGSRNLYVSAVLHKAFIEVNEEGSEAAAATAVIMKGRSISRFPPAEPVEFRADHPFLFYIVDNSTKAILFFGRVTKP